jgi:hypothetical protein
MTSVVDFPQTPYYAEVTVRAIRRYLGLDPDGPPVPMQTRKEGIR